MTNLNQFTISGNLTADSLLKTTPSGLAVCSFSVALNRTFTEGNEKKTAVTFINNLAIIDKRATALAPYLKKGVKVIVQGHFATDKESKLVMKPDFIELVKFPKKAEEVSQTVIDEEADIEQKVDWEMSGNEQIF